VTAAGNVDAIHQVRARSVDVVVTDPDTPVHDDLALVEELRASRPGLEAIVRAPEAAPREFIAAVRIHVFWCFVAPFDIAEVAEMTKRAIEAVAGFDPEKVIHVTAVRTERAIVYHFHDPGPGFTPGQLERSALSNTEADPIAHLAPRADMGLRLDGFGILVARQIVDEMFDNERGNEVLLIKRLA
jgi:hypothetical protein